MRRALSALGRTLVTAGLLILAFVGYQLWGTGIYQARAQGELKSDFEERLVTPTTTPPRPSTPSTSTTVPPPPPAGEAVAIIRIPRIGVEQAVVEGVGVPDLRKGPGHYPLTPLPGQILDFGEGRFNGNAAIAGHRTTYGAPFNRLDELSRNDTIDVTTLSGSYTFRVTDLLVVAPTQVEVLNPTDSATLTLTTCNPKYSAAERLVIKATLIENLSSPGVEVAASETELATFASIDDDGLSGESESRLPTLWWAVLLVVTGGLWWLVFHRYHRWTTWVGGLIPFAVVLFFFYAHLERLLPTNY